MLSSQNVLEETRDQCHYHYSLNTQLTLIEINDLQFNMTRKCTIFSASVYSFVNLFYSLCFSIITERPRLS